MSMSLKGTDNQQRITFTQFVNQQQRQFGKEISNISSRCNVDMQPFKSQTTQSLSQIPRSKSSSMKLDTLRCKSIDLKQKIEEENPNPQTVNIYVSEIFEYVKSQEFKFLSNPYYMNHQQDINCNMRSILIDWLIDVHMKFKLVHETLFLTINLIDRFLSKNQTLRSKLQLVGVAAMFTACKYEEIYAPELKDFVYVCDHAYSKEDILDMESKILMTIQFNMTNTSPLRFLDRQIAGANICERVSHTAKMILDLSLMDIKSLKYTSSIQSTAAILLAINLLKSPQVLPSSLHYVDNQEELKQCLQDYLPIIQQLSHTSLTAVRRKYSLEKYTKVSEIVLQILLLQAAQQQANQQ